MLNRKIAVLAIAYWSSLEVISVTKSERQDASRRWFAKLFPGAVSIELHRRRAPKPLRIRKASAIAVRSREDRGDPVVD